MSFNEKEWLKKVITELFGKEAAERLEKSSSNPSLPTPTTPTTTFSVQSNMEGTNVVGVVGDVPKESPTTVNGGTETNNCDSMCRNKYPGSDQMSMLLYGKCLMECTEQQLGNQQQQSQKKQQIETGTTSWTTNLPMGGPTAQNQQSQQQGQDVDPQCEFNCRRRYLDFERDEAGYKKCLSKCLECPPGTRYDPYMDMCLRVMQ